MVVIGTLCSFPFHLFAFQVLAERRLWRKPLHKFLKSEAGITVKIKSTNYSHDFTCSGLATVSLQEDGQIFLINVAIIPVING